ncbi:MAG: PH domain-containing protein [Alphaproteobacteria bacterium]|nr:PH domain-containing protein [Alphaproteobacteria bacterium]
MHYVAKHLSNNEEICYVAKIHWVDYFRVICYNIYYLLCVLFALAMSGNMVIILLMLVILLVGDLYFYLMHYHFLEMVITNKRVVLKTGIISVHTEELIIKEIETIEIEQTFWGRILNYANIYFTGKGSSAVEFATVKNPSEIKQIVEDHKG